MNFTKKEFVSLKECMDSAIESEEQLLESISVHDAVAEENMHEAKTLTKNIMAWCDIYEKIYGIAKDLQKNTIRVLMKNDELQAKEWASSYGC